MPVANSILRQPKSRMMKKCTSRVRRWAQGWRGRNGETAKRLELGNTRPPAAWYRLFRHASARFAHTEREDLLIWSVSAKRSSLGNCFANSEIRITKSIAPWYTAKSRKCFTVVITKKRNVSEILLPSSCAALLRPVAVSPSRRFERF